MPTLVFASDSHLNRHYGRMTPEQLAGRRVWLRRGWQQSIDHALKVGAELYVHGGDLFDGPNPRATEMIWAAQQFQRLAERGVRSFLIGGNHDVPRTRQGGVTPQRLFAEVRQATVFADPTRVTWWEGEVGGLRVAIGGLPPDPRLERVDVVTGGLVDPFDRLEEPIEPPAADHVILVMHYAIEGLLGPQAEEPTVRKSSIEALSGKVHHLLVGHVHAAKQMQVGDVQVILPGPTERMGFGELELRCGFVELKLEGRGRVKAQRHAIAAQPMRRETVHAPDIPADDPTGWLVERVRGWSAPEQLLQVRLQGPLDREAYHRLRFTELSLVGQELNFYFDLDRHGLSLRDVALDVPELAYRVRPSPRGEIQAVATAMMDAAPGEEERALLEEARALALERYGAGSESA